MKNEEEILSPLDIPEGVFRPEDPVGDDGLTDAERQYLAEHHREWYSQRPEDMKTFNDWLKGRRG